MAGDLKYNVFLADNPKYNVLIAHNYKRNASMPDKPL